MLLKTGKGILMHILCLYKDINAYYLCTCITYVKGVTDKLMKCWFPVTVIM